MSFVVRYGRRGVAAGVEEASAVALGGMPVRPAVSGRRGRQTEDAAAAVDRVDRDGQGGVMSFGGGS
ncbi:hypothetical protein [Streptomyces sp. MA5143a]|uniref:hypothetical protein n=1 Tax=Streptomyces sp. MA5143a TaxID=2083010 RepID=UPI000D1AA928|nr:hypothetical protein [Streptomyces sp. MA5143a]